jgi:short-chain Z-isoprenyl diphosphate synthase
MDGNRRFARKSHQPVVEGHREGANTAARILEWWVRYLPHLRPNHSPSIVFGETGASLGGKGPSRLIHGQSPAPRYLTLWAFSSENFLRSASENAELFSLLTHSLLSLASSPLIHLFRIRIRIIGSKTSFNKFPAELKEAITKLEKLSSWAVSDVGEEACLSLQIALGYGGREEIVDAVRSLVDEGHEVTEASLGQEMYCAKIGVKSVDMIVRTSEHRTSGFFLWDILGAELYFIDKLWPELGEGDWLGMLGSFSRREIRRGL